MSRDRSAFRNRVEALAVSVLRGVFARMSPERAEAVGRRLGLAYRLVDGRRRELARANIARAFPAKPAEDVDALSRAVFAHFGGVAAEILHASGRPIAETLARLEVVGGPLALAAARSGRGVFLLTAHLGNWEWAALAVSAAGFRIAVIARPLDNPVLDARLTALRTSTGNRVIPKREAARDMLRSLKDGGAIGILMDQHASPADGVTAPFFGRPASTASAIARLVDRTEALVLPTAALRVGPARRRITFYEPLDVRTLAPAEREVAPLTARFTRILEDLIRQAPEQWLWLHNRWRLPDQPP